MGKAILVLLVIGAGIAGYIVYVGYQRVGGDAMKDRYVAEKEARDAKDAGAAKSEGPGTLDKFGSAVKEGAKAVGEKVQYGARVISKEAKELIFGDMKLTIDPYPIEVETGKKAVVKIRRQGGEMEALTLDIKVGSGANVSISGGEFAKKQAETTLTVMALPGQAGETQLTLRAGEAQAVVPIIVR